MNGKCPFCDTFFDAGKKTNTNINRHLRRMASKQAEERGNHPEVNSPAYGELAKTRGFRTLAKSLEERKEMTAARKKRFREAQKKIRSGNVSVGDPTEMDIKKEEDEFSSLQFSSEVRERIAKAIQKLISHIDSPEVIPKPINTVPLNPSFPQIAFRYLPFEACISHDNRPNGVSEGPNFAILNQYHYCLLQSLCSKRVLENAWTQWLRLGECHEDRQRDLQWEEAKNMRSRWLLFQKVLTGKHGYDLQRERFERECYKKGYAELASLMKGGTIWADVSWDSFAYFAELYQPLPLVPGTSSAAVLPRIEDADKRDGGKVSYKGVSGKRSLRDLKENCVIPGTPSLEL